MTTTTVPISVLKIADQNKENTIAKFLSLKEDLQKAWTKIQSGNTVDFGREEFTKNFLKKHPKV